MKRFVLIIFILCLGLCCRAQYHPYYDYYHDPYGAAAYGADRLSRNEQIRQLNNIRFDEEAIAKNPAALEEYRNYLSRHKEYETKGNNWFTLECLGLGLSFVGTIPLIIGGPGDSALTDMSYCAIGAGLIGALIGSIGVSTCNEYKISNKENFIFYLKTTNNGIGIVSLF